MNKFPEAVYSEYTDLLFKNLPIFYSTAEKINAELGMDHPDMGVVVPLISQALRHSVEVDLTFMEKHRMKFKELKEFKVSLHEFSQISVVRDLIADSTKYLKMLSGGLTALKDPINGIDIAYNRGLDNDLAYIAGIIKGIKACKE